MNLPRIRLAALVMAACGPPAPTDGPDSEADTEDSPVVDTDPAPARLPDDLGAGFTEVAASAVADAGLVVFAGDRAPPTTPPVDTTAMLGDLDGDGQPEVVVAGFRTERDAPTDADLTRVFNWEAGRLVLDEAKTSALAGWGDVTGLADVDGDGRADLLGRSMASLVRYADGATLSLGDADDAVAVVPVDLDADGWLDLLLVADGCTREVPALRVAWRTGPRQYELGTASALQGIELYTTAMVPVVDGTPVLMPLGGECEPDPFTGFLTADSVDGVGRPVFTPDDLTPADARYKANPFVAGGPITRAHPMGLAVADMNTDGLLDLVIPTAGPYLEVFLGTGAVPMADASLEAELVNPDASTGQGRYQIPWGTVPIDLDRDGRPDLVVAYGNDDASWERDDLGPQGISAWWNDGTAVFTDVTGLSGLGTAGQWRAVTTGDLDGDGDADLLVGGQGQVPAVYRNDIETGGSLALRLEGTVSNGLGLGARVRVLVDGLPPQEMVAGGVASPLVSSEPWLFASTGDQLAARRVEITWPSGIVQGIDDLAAGRVHTVVEPDDLRIEPVSRHQDADGSSTVDVWVRGDDVQVRRAAGVAVSVGAPMKDGEGWRVAVVAPTTSGSTQLELTVDGRTMGVLPRLWWDSLQE